MLCAYFLHFVSHRVKAGNNCIFVYRIKMRKRIFVHKFKTFQVILVIGRKITVQIFCLKDYFFITHNLTSFFDYFVTDNFKMLSGNGIPHKQIFNLLLGYLYIRNFYCKVINLCYFCAHHSK